MIQEKICRRACATKTTWNTKCSPFSILEFELVAKGISCVEAKIIQSQKGVHIINVPFALSCVHLVLLFRTQKGVYLCVSLHYVIPWFITVCPLCLCLLEKRSVVYDFTISSASFIAMGTKCQSHQNASFLCSLVVFLRRCIIVLSYLLLKFTISFAERGV